MKKYNTRTMVHIAMFTTISIVLYMFEFYILPGSPLQADLSDLPVMIAGYLMGIGPGIMVAFLKNVIHALFLSKNAGIAGELANFFFAVAIMLPIGYFKVKNKLKQGGIYIGTILFAAGIMNVFNYFITFPLYGMSREGAWTLLFTIFFPFNLVKGGILCIFFALLRPHLHRISGL